MNTETNRKYKCAFTKEEYTLFRNTQTGAFSLIKTKDNANFDYPIGNEISGFEIRAYDVLYKFKDKTQKLVKRGEFLPLELNKHYTHYKIVGMSKRFIKK